MKYLQVVLFWFGLSAMGDAQTPQWAGKVLGVSSEYKGAPFPGQFTAARALGPPNRLPSGTSNPNAWSSNLGGNFEWIKVGFDKPVKGVRQIAVVESCYPGSITKIYFYEPSGTEHQAYSWLKPGAPDEKGRVLYKFMEPTTYEVAALKIELNPSTVEGPTQIDAIAISTSTDSVKVAINVSPEAAEAGKPESLGELVNSYADELCPVIAPDGKTLYFTRQNHKENIGPPDAQDIWVCTTTDGKNFSKAFNIGVPLNNGANNSFLSVSPDGQYAILNNLYVQGREFEKGISYSLKLDGKWTDPLPVEIDSFYNDNVFGEYCLSTSGKFLVMTIQRKNSIGNKDIYVSFNKGDGTWTVPKNLGPTVNTADSEVSPFLAADEMTLYFSTAGWPGYGKHDMFLTRRLDSTWTNWTTPENLGPVFNSKGWDAYYTIPASGEYAYFCSSNNSLGGNDILRAKLPEGLRPDPVVLIRGVVRNRKTNEPMRAVISYENLSTGEPLGLGLSDDITGEYTIVLPAGSNYGFLPMADGYISISDNIDLLDVMEYSEIRRDLYLVPLEVGQTIRMNNIFFDSGKSLLRKESRLELDRLVKLLNAHPGMEIEITGHTDNVGEDASNLVLSQQRTASVKKYLEGKGIVTTRMKTKGYGESQPVDNNNTPQGRQNNRRVEFVILKI